MFSTTWLPWSQVQYKKRDKEYQSYRKWVSAQALLPNSEYNFREIIPFLESSFINLADQFFFLVFC